MYNAYPQGTEPNNEEQLLESGLSDRGARLASLVVMAESHFPDSSKAVTDGDIARRAKLVAARNRVRLNHNE